MPQSVLDAVRGRFQVIGLAADRNVTTLVFPGLLPAHADAVDFQIFPFHHPPGFRRFAAGTPQRHPLGPLVGFAGEDFIGRENVLKTIAQLGSPEHAPGKLAFPRHRI